MILQGLEMPTLKLMYFNGRGRAEVARLILAHSGTAYEDVRYEKEQWPAVKPSKSGEHTIPGGPPPPHHKWYINEKKKGGGGRREKRRKKKKKK